MATKKQKTTHKKSTLRTALILALIAAAIVLVTGGMTNTSHHDYTVSSEGVSFGLSDDGFALGSEPGSASPHITTNRDSAYSKAMVDTPQAPSAPEAPAETDRHIIKTSAMHLLVDDLHMTIGAISQMAYDFGGDVINDNTSVNDHHEAYAHMTIHVPTDDFDRARAHIRSLATHVTHENSNKQDVTEEYIDLESRLTQKKAYEQQILDEILPRAVTVDDLITVEDHLSGVRTEIERMEARIQHLRTQTTNSTITITLTQEPRSITETQWRPGSVAIDATNTLITRIQSIIDHGIRIAISGLPIFILSLIGLSILYTISKRIITKINKHLNH